MTAVVSLGSVNADFVVRVAESPSGPGSTLAEGLLRTSGGKGANVAVLAARLGVGARLLGCVGDDDLADQALAGPEAARVNLRGVRRRRGPTGYASILVPPDGRETIVLVPNANDAWDEDGEKVAAEVDAAPDGSVLVVDLEVPVAQVTAALTVARERGLATVLDPAPPDRLTDELLALADHVVPDASEAGRITGTEVDDITSATKAALDLVRRGAGCAHVKLAGGGAVVATATEALHVEAPADISVVDATGAGDAYAGGLAWALLAKLPLAEAVVFAVAASTCAVTGYGSQESYPTEPELRAMAARVPSRQLLPGPTPDRVRSGRKR